MKNSLSVGTVAVALLVFGTAAQCAEMMNAAVVVDGRAVLQKVPRPQAGAGQVLMRVRAAAVNPVDWRSASGEGPGAPRGPQGPRGAGAPPAGGGRRGGPPMPAGPQIPGFDAAGVIEAVGPDVGDWKPGDEIIAFSDRTGAYAEYLTVPIDAITRKPAELTFDQAAGIPTVAYAAWAVLVDIANVKSGDRVLVHGAAGGTGSAAVQIAKARGAWVIATASQQNHDYVRSLGADELIDYRNERFEDRAKDIDVVFNNVDTETANRSISVVRPGGIIVYITGTIDSGRVAAAGIRASGRVPGGTPVGEVLRQIALLAADGKYDVNVDSRFSLDQVEEAWAHSRDGSPRGKIIISIPQPSS